MRGAQLQAAGWPWWHRCSLPVALGNESLLSWHNQECTELVGMMQEKSGWNWPRSSAFGPTKKPFPCPVMPPRTLPRHLPQELGTVDPTDTVKKGTTFLSHEQFCLKAIQKQHSESQLPGLAVKFTETLIDWCS